MNLSLYTSRFIDYKASEETKTVLNIRFDYEIPALNIIVYSNIKYSLETKITCLRWIDILNVERGFCWEKEKENVYNIKSRGKIGEKILGYNKL